MADLSKVLNDSIGIDEYLFKEMIAGSFYNSDLLFANDYEDEDEDEDDEFEDEDEDLFDEEDILEEEGYEEDFDFDEEEEDDSDEEDPEA